MLNSLHLPPYLQGRSTAWLQAWHRRRQLRRQMGACCLLFQRRRSLIEAEQVGADAASLGMPTVAVQRVGGSRAAEFAQASGASLQLLAEQPETALEDFLREWLPAQQPQTVV